MKTTADQPLSGIVDIRLDVKESATLLAILLATANRGEPHPTIEINRAWIATITGMSMRSVSRALDGLARREIIYYIQHNHGIKVTLLIKHPLALPATQGCQSGKPKRNTKDCQSDNPERLGGLNVRKNRQGCQSGKPKRNTKDCQSDNPVKEKEKERTKEKEKEKENISSNVRYNSIDVRIGTDVRLKEEERKEKEKNLLDFKRSKEDKRKEEKEKINTYDKSKSYDSNSAAEQLASIRSLVNQLAAAKTAHMRAPTWAEWELWCYRRGIPETDARAIYEHYNARGWLDRKGNPITNWQMLINSISKRQMAERWDKERRNGPLLREIGF